MKRMRNGMLLFLIGSSGYSLIEVLWRKYTHWTMALTGGVCFVVLHGIFRRCRPLWKKCVYGAASITGVEFTVGCVVNRLLGWNVWDYSHMSGNLLGQVCPLYTFLWSLLCIPVSGLSRLLDRHLLTDKS
ncbi:hypothetical protein H8711_01625 [Clostridiaceae bacterium NSJ-31]|uniref:ABC-transporter type IV n=1 Tax=Ligaoa zhengdingensis TaxID=2763658 RepID=A0A926DXG7_9FIRM|nr:putative ABC transporter permease [Ligaoa zhengdingensis]MBC8545637.1 hypothetical protein [Ligaoa zhengdingensis]